MKKLKHLLPALGLLISIRASAQSEKTFQWIGGPTYVLRLGSFKILTDPMFSPKGDSAFILPQHPTTGAINAPITRLIAPAKFDTADIDLLLISHPHADHVDKEARNALNKHMQVIEPGVNKALIEKWGFDHNIGLSWGDSTVFVKGDETLTIVAVEARHAKDDPLRTALGKGNGYIIEYFDGHRMYRIYWTGDTVWFDEIAGYTRYGKLDLLIPDMGAVGSDGPIGRRGLNASDALKIVLALNPAMITPVHHSTFSMYVEPISVLQDTLDSSPYKGRLHIIKTGDRLDLGAPDKTFQWIGGPTFVLQLGSFKILTDPMFSPKGNSADTSNLDLLLISHPHEDHFDREARNTLSKNLLVIAPAVNKALIRSWGFGNTVGLNWKDSTVLVKGEEILMIIAMKAIHSKNDVLGKAPDKGNGYMITYFDGEKMYRIYWPGDTVWFDEIAGYASYGKIDLLIPELGPAGPGNKDSRKGFDLGDCGKIVRALDPSMVTPVRHSLTIVMEPATTQLQVSLDEPAYYQRLRMIKTGNILIL